MPTRARRLAYERKHRARVWGTMGAILLALTPFVIPRLPFWIVVVLAVIWLASWPMSRYGYFYNIPLRWAICVMLIHAVIIAALGYFIWPRITVGPSHVSFSGYPNETFNFSVRNGRADAVYDVQIPFFIGRNKHFDSKLSAKLIGNDEPSGPLRDDYNYCYGVKGDGVVTHAQKNEQEVLVVRIPHLIPYGSGAFSITYSGGDKLPDIKPGAPDFIGEPYSYSPTSGVVDVRGDYRICKIAMSPSGK